MSRDGIFGCVAERPGEGAGRETGEVRDISRSLHVIGHREQETGVEVGDRFVDRRAEAGAGAPPAGAVEVFVRDRDDADLGGGAEGGLKQQPGPAGVRIGGEDIEGRGGGAAALQPSAQGHGGDIGAVALHTGSRCGVQAIRWRTKARQGRPADLGEVAVVRQRLAFFNRAAGADQRAVAAAVKFRQGRPQSGVGRPALDDQHIGGFAAGHRQKRVERANGAQDDRGAEREQEDGAEERRTADGARTQQPPLFQPGSEVAQSIHGADEIARRAGAQARGGRARRGRRAR